MDEAKLNQLHREGVRFARVSLSQYGKVILNFTDIFCYNLKK
jgi:hypothetical protein